MSFLGRVSKWFGRLWGWLAGPPPRPIITNQAVVRQYVLAATHFANTINEVSFLPRDNIEQALVEWERAEQLYAERGFRTLALSEFIDFTAWSVPLKNVGVKRQVNEEALHHAKFYRMYCLRTSGIQELRTLLMDEGLLDMEPTRRLRRYHS